ncbi:MAG: hypothetical protein CVU71_03665 [Deltaproteobacteria bacterium HGW-Deltaproteobacteria-6]|jgi:hypothetical protein|nr:MAG: hypothetical protein CVU71_03665 [Deltaproteobacteria bacterium HGW-Deltaproteobacteria-6]
MASNYALSRETLKELADNFGLKHVRNLQINIPRDGIVTITAEIYPEIDGVRQLLTTIKKYRLEEIQNG